MLSAEDIRAVFNKFDEDSSGQLELTECMKCITELGINVTDENEFNNFWKDADTNQDYKISFNEFMGWIRVGRHSGVVDLMKKHVAVIKRMEAIKDTLKGLKDIQPEEGDVDDGETDKIMDFQVKSGESEGKTVIKFEVKTGKKNTIPRMLKLVFMNYKETETQLYFTMRAKEDASKLQSTMNNFFSNLMLSIELKYPQVFSNISDLRFKVGQFNDKVILLVNLGGSELTYEIMKALEEINELLRQPAPQLSIKMRSNLDLKYCIEQINRAEDQAVYQGQDAAEATIDNTNLLKFLVTGFSLNIILSCKTVIKDKLLEFLTGFVAKIDSHMEFDNYLVKYYEKFLKITNSMVNIPQNNLQEKCKKWNEENPDIPDAADLVDEIGFMFENYQDFLTNHPFVEEFLDDLKENGLFDIEMGIVDDGTKVSLGMVTSGAVELYNEVLQGMQEVEVQSGM